SIIRSDGVTCGSSNSRIAGQACPPLVGNQRIQLRIPRLNLVPGVYNLSVAISDEAAPFQLDNKVIWFDVASEIPNLTAQDYGVLLFDHWWDLSGATSPVAAEPGQR
ncbi:MAG: hypothetical protein ACYCOU_04885, partial [Sulfobacillus sp.]